MYIGTPAGLFLPPSFRSRFFEQGEIEKEGHSMGRYNRFSAKG